MYGQQFTLPKAVTHTRIAPRLRGREFFVMFEGGRHGTP